MEEPNIARHRAEEISIKKIKSSEIDENKKLTAEQMEQVKGGAAYIKFEGVDGESQHKDHKGWIDLVSVNTKRTGR